MDCPKKENTCAHEASKYLSSKYSELNAGSGTNLRAVSGMLRCSCGLVLRAKELRDWAASKGSIEEKVKPKGLYLIYQENESEGKGHVFVKDDGENHGNGNYNWSKSTKETIYKLE